MTAKNLHPDEYNSYYQPYIDKANNLTLSEGLITNCESVSTFLESIPDAKLEYRYADGKWTIKEIVLHLIDTERIFAYRALRIARNDKTALPGFDQDEYVPTSMANERTFDSILSEYKAVRFATIALFDSFNDDMLKRIGTASNSSLSARAVGFITMGHENHHCEVIRNRYL